MDRLRAARHAPLALAIGLACSAGCQSLGHAPKPSASVSGGDLSRMPTTAQQADVQIALGRAAEQRGELDQAAALYRAALERDRNRADALVRLAILADRRGQFTESADLYAQALKADPGNPDIFCDYGYSLYLQRRWDEARTNLRQAIALKSDHARAHNNLGLVLAHAGAPEDALDEFLQAGCGAAQAHENLAFALTLDRRFDEARRQYELAQAADPSSPVARQRSEELDAVAAKLAGAPPAVALQAPTSQPAPVVALEAPPSMARPVPEVPAPLPPVADVAPVASPTALDEALVPASYAPPARTPAPARFAADADMPAPLPALDVVPAPPRPPVTGARALDARDSALFPPSYLVDPAPRP